MCGSEAWRVSEVNKQPYCQNASRCLLSSLLSSLPTIPLSFPMSFSFLLFLCLSVVSYLTRSDKKQDFFSSAAESWLLWWRVKKTDTVLVLVWVFVTLMHTKNLSCDTDREEIEPGKIWWHHSSLSLNSSSMKSLHFIMLSVLSFTYCCFDWFVTEVCTFPLIDLSVLD